MTMTTDFDLTEFKTDQGFLTLLNFQKSNISEKNSSLTRTSNVWVYLTCKVKLESLLKSFSIYFSKKLSQHNERLLEQHGEPGIKEYLHHYPQQHFRCDHCLHRYIKHRQRLSYTVWFMSLLILSFFSPSKVSALHDRRVIVEPWSRIKIVSSTHSFISGLSSGNPIITREYFDRPLDKDINRLVDRSEDIIKIQDEEESRMTRSKVKPVKDSKDFRCPLLSSLEHGFIEGKDSRVGDTLYFRCKPGYKLIGPSRITCTTLQYLYRTVVKWDSTEKQFCKNIIGENHFDKRRPYYLTNSRSQSMLIFWKRILPWNLYSMQLKLMSNAMYRCRFPKQKDVCRSLVAHYYFNIRRLKCELYHFGSCHDHANQFKTFEECQQICSRLSYQ